MISGNSIEYIIGYFLLSSIHQALHQGRNSPEDFKPPTSYKRTLGKGENGLKISIKFLEKMDTEGCRKKKTVLIPVFMP